MKIYMLHLPCVVAKELLVAKLKLCNQKLFLKTDIFIFRFRKQMLVPLL